MNQALAHLGTTSPLLITQQYFRKMKAGENNILRNHATECEEHVLGQSIVENVHECQSFNRYYYQYI